MKKLLLGICVVMLTGIHCQVQGQSKYQTLDNYDGVIFHYRWKNSKLFKKDSPYMLLLKIENTNSYPVQTAFVVDYYWETVRKASSSRQTHCIKANKKIKGRMDDLGFDRAGLTNEQLESDDFIMELSDIKIEKSTDCI